MAPRNLETWMWAEACEALARAERLQREFFRLGSSNTRPNWEPPVDIFETARELTILAALPGVGPRRSRSLSPTASSPSPATAARRRSSAPPPSIAWRFRKGGSSGASRCRRASFELAQHELHNGCLTLVLAKRR